MQPVGHLVEIRKPRGHPAELPLLAVVVLDDGDGAGDQVLDVLGRPLLALLADAKNVALHLVEQLIHFPLMLMDPANHSAARLKHPAEQVFLPDDAEVVFQVCRAGDGIHQAGQVSQSANRLQLLHVLQPLLNRDEIHRLPAVIHHHQVLKQSPMPQIIEAFPACLELLQALADGLRRVEEHASQHALFRLNGVRWQTVQRAGRW